MGSQCKDRGGEVMYLCICKSQSDFVVCGDVLMWSEDSVDVDSTLREKTKKTTTITTQQYKLLLK